jgi:RTX calcium-binding nonapeptide repeat (4 copies)
VKKLAFRALVFVSIVAGAGGNDMLPVTSVDRAEAALAVVAASQSSGDSSRGARRPGCTISALLVPSCGAWWGIAEGPRGGESEGQAQVRIEGAVGRRFQLVREFHRVGNLFPTATELAWARRGRHLFLSWAPHRHDGSPVSFTRIRQGLEDAAIDALASRLKRIPNRFFFAFAHEPEDELRDRRWGSAADYVAATRRIHARFRLRGVRNVIWVWVVSGWSRNYGLYRAIYPGDDVIDWVAWDPYNWGTCRGIGWQSFAETVQPFYRWASANGHGDKPFMLAEYGSHENPSDSAAKGRWFRRELAVMKAGRFPRLKAVVYFDYGRDCGWPVDTSQASLEGFRTTGQDRFFHPTARCTIVGTPRRDVLTGTSRRDVICGRGGNDSIRARGGSDTVFGGRGRDRIHGGPGRDVLFGGPGADVIYARDRNRDVIRGGPGVDRARVDPRIDRIKSIARLF